MLLSPGALNFLLVGARDGFADGVMAIYGNASPPTTASDAFPGTLLGLVTKNGGPFTPGDPTNGLTFDVPAMGVMQKPPGDVWKLKATADGIATYGVLLSNAADPGTTDPTGLRPRGIVKVGNVRGTLILSNAEMVTGREYTVDDLTIDFPAQSLV